MIRIPTRTLCSSACSLLVVLACFNVRAADDFEKTVKKYLGVQGNFAKAGVKNVVIRQFEVEYVVTKYESRQVTGRGSSTIELGDEAYRKLTDAIYGSFVAALGEVSGITVIPKEKLIADTNYAGLKGYDKVDTRDQMISLKRAGNVKTRDAGMETVTYAPTGMKVLSDLVAGFTASAGAQMAGEQGADSYLDVRFMVSFDKKTDVPYISEASVAMPTKMNKRQKMIPFKGAVPGVFIYEFLGAPASVSLKEPVSTETKVTDRRTGFFGQTSGTFNIDGQKMALSIYETCESIIALEAAAMAQKK